MLRRNDGFRKYRNEALPTTGAYCCWIFEYGTQEDVTVEELVAIVCVLALFHDYEFKTHKEKWEKTGQLTEKLRIPLPEKTQGIYIRKQMTTTQSRAMGSGKKDDVLSRYIA